MERERERESQRISEREREKERETVRERENKKEKSEIEKFPQEIQALFGLFYFWVFRLKALLSI